ncbi:MAG: sulfatase [Bryobacteraceae bacterium]|nr:sulfatase [Bryobacteraceae bacterium]
MSDVALMSRRRFIGALGAATPGWASQRTKPNILMVLMDDLGYGALSCFGNKLVATPNLDRIAGQGIRFTDAYVTPQCTPTRATLLTGQYTARNRMWHVIPAYQYPQGAVKEPPFRENLGREAFTLAKGLKEAGYATACIGKWHLTVGADGDYNGLRPDAAQHYGFDTVATPSAIPKEFSTGDKAVNRFTEEAIRFIGANKETPWFCYLPHHSIHNVVSAPDDLVRKYREKGFPAEGLNNATYLAAIEHFDAAIGRLIRSIDDSGLGQNTLVLFLSDNGGIFRSWKPNPPGTRLEDGQPQLSNAPLRAGKGSSYEGGIRVPMIARWTGTIRGGQTCRTPVHIVDLMPTFFDLAGARAPQGYVTDGVSLTPLLQGKRIPPRALYWYQPFYDVRWLASPSAMVRDGDWKLLEFFGDYIEEMPAGAEYRPGVRLELYNLRDDPGERRDLAASMPTRAAAMRRKLHDWIRSTGSPVPGPNANYNPERPLLEARGMPQ